MQKSYHKEGSLKPIGLSVTKEVANHQNGEDKQADHEDLKVKVQWLAHCPGNEDNEGTVKEGGLD